MAYIRIEQDERYPVFSIERVDKPFRPDWRGHPAEMSEEQIERYHRIVSEYDKLQAELEQLFEQGELAD
jgi:hypothetical protein